jgi:hypothetical protein
MSQRLPRRVHVMRTTVNRGAPGHLQGNVPHHNLCQRAERQSNGLSRSGRDISPASRGSADPIPPMPIQHCSAKLQLESLAQAHQDPSKRVTFLDVLHHVTRENNELTPLDALGSNKATPQQQKKRKDALKAWSKTNKEIKGSQGAAAVSLRLDDFSYSDGVQVLKEVGVVEERFLQQLKRHQLNATVAKRRGKKSKTKGSKGKQKRPSQASAAGGDTPSEEAQSGAASASGGRKRPAAAAGAAAAAATPKRSKQTKTKPQKKRPLSGGREPILIVRAAPAAQLIAGEKTWEIRTSSHKKHVGSRIWIRTTKQGGGKVLGSVHFAACRKVTAAEMDTNVACHQLGAGWRESQYCKDKTDLLWAWVMAEPQPLSPAVAVESTPGQVKWSSWVPRSSSAAAPVAPPADGPGR